jgi:LysM repeat protein
MFRKFSLIILIAVAAVFLLSACERSAVPAQSSKATPAGQSTSTPQIVALLDTYKTQTAVVLISTLQTHTPSSLIGATPTPTATLLGGTTPVPTNTPVPPTAVSNVPTLTPGHPATYTLKKGEFPYCLARRFNVDPNDLLSANGINVNDADKLPEGKVLNIPQSGSYPGTRARINHPAQYTVRMDDTIYSIACAYGDVDPVYMAAYNGIAAPYVLQVGKVLNIP